MSIATQTHIINLYKGGKFIGFLSSSGGVNRLRLHAARLDREKAEILAAEITEMNTEEGITAKAVAPKKG